MLKGSWGNWYGLHFLLARPDFDENRLPSIEPFAISEHNSLFPFGSFKSMENLKWGWLPRFVLWIDVYKINSFMPLCYDDRLKSFEKWGNMEIYLLTFLCRRGSF